MAEQANFTKFTPYPPQVPEDQCPGHDYEYIGKTVHEIPINERKGWEIEYSVKRGRCIHCGDIELFIGNYTQWTDKATGRQMIRRRA